MGPLGNMVQKELMEMVRDPRLLLGMILVPILIFPIMGVAIGSSMQATEEAMRTSGVVLYSQDGSDGHDNYTATLFSFLEHSNLSVRNLSAADPDEALRKAEEGGAKVLLAVPANFSENIRDLKYNTIGVYAIFRDFSFTEGSVYTQVIGALDLFNGAVVAERLQAAYPNESKFNLTFPLVSKSESVIRGRVHDADPNAVGAGVMGSTMVMPMMLMMLLIMAGQLAATSVAMEKEQKTLEVLLSLPVRRINILIGKLSGVIAVSMFATLSYLVGFTFYFNSLGMGGGRANLTELGLSPEPIGIVLLGVTLLLSFISALSLAVLLSVFTKDVRSAQSLMGLLYIPVIVPALVLMFSPVGALPGPMQAVVLAIPFSYPIIASQALYTQQYLLVAFGIVYQAIFTAAVLALAARVFSTEKILTAKLELGRKRQAPRE
ncbi:MAG: ABC transporter permease [Euryarchaeota archaeon]|nr:ABC transporter permease [Euryarchaeota archaeon]